MAFDNEGNRTAIDELIPPVMFASTRVNSDAGTAVQDHPAITLGSESPNPASYLIWDDQRDGATNSNIDFARRDGVTGAWSANVKVNTDSGRAIRPTRRSRLTAAEMPTRSGKTAATAPTTRSTPTSTPG